jgi:F420H(2)-dependent quinone reductase
VPLEGRYGPSGPKGARVQAETYEATDGREANTIGSRPIVVMTSRGARSGLLRKTALMRVEHEGRYLAVGSLGGGPRDPRWVHNLRAYPLVELQDGAARRDYRVRELDGDERVEWWARAVDAFPTYARYAERTSRRIPVFLLEPVAASEDAATG